MSRFKASASDDLLSMLKLAPRRRTNPFAVMEALGEVLERRIPPPAIGGAVLAFDASLAAEARDFLEGRPGATARFFQAAVPGDTDGPGVEAAWQSAAHALTKLRRFTRAPSAAQQAVLMRLAKDDVFLAGAQVALATADPRDVEVNRWFLPLLILDGSEASVDALLPHLDAARGDSGPVVAALRPLARLPTASLLLREALGRLVR